ncbi:MAG: cadherin-like beta sandwich domain-containing protein [Spirochaetales bacterium]|nr:cadherin-like beta sandwich domain-containing protein [Spirochaetales bacterium]
MSRINKRFVLLLGLVFLFLSCKELISTGDSNRDNADLNALRILANGNPTPIDFTPNFDPDVLEYRIQVPGNTEYITIYGIANHFDAQVSLTGINSRRTDLQITPTRVPGAPAFVIRNLKGGENTITATIISANEELEKSYTIIIDVEQIPIRLVATTPARLISEQSLVATTYTITLEGYDWNSGDLSLVRFRLLLDDPDNQLNITNGYHSRLLSLSLGSQRHQIRMTGRSTNDGDTENGMATFSFDTFGLEGRNSDRYSISAEPFTVTVYDDDAPYIHPFYGGGGGSRSIVEGGTQGLGFTLNNNDLHPDNVTITPVAQGLTFNPPSVTLNRLVRFRQMTIQVPNDSIHNADRDLSITFSTSRDTPLVTANGNGVLDFTIRDNDAPQVSMGLYDESISEGESIHGYLSLSNAPFQALTAHYSASVESGYTLSNYIATEHQTGNIPIAEGATSAIFSIPTIDGDVDDALNPNVTITITGITPNASNGGAGIVSSASSDSIRLTDNDLTQVSLSQATSVLPENGGFSILTFTLSRALEEAVTVSYTITGTADPDNPNVLTPSSAWSDPGSGSITIAAGSTSNTLRISAVNNGVRSSFQQGFTVNLTAASSTNSLAEIDDNNDAASFTIREDD